MQVNATWQKCTLLEGGDILLMDYQIKTIAYGGTS